jgi:hypothetical protein
MDLLYHSIFDSGLYWITTRIEGSRMEEDVPLFQPQQTKVRELYITSPFLAKIG